MSHLFIRVSQARMKPEYIWEMCIRDRFYTTTFVTTVLFLLVRNFFRSPFRRFPFDSEGLVIAPAEGTIVAIEEAMENEILHRECLQISIFMSVFNVHANWFPVNGTVTVSYTHLDVYKRQAYVSRFFTLKIGDMIYTGTPVGVGPVKIDDHLQG